MEQLICKFNDLKNFGNNDVSEYVDLVIKNIENLDISNSSFGLYKDYYNKQYEKLIDICLKGVESNVS